MGCDIHMYVEYKPKDQNNISWKSFGGGINPGRNYYVFGLLSKGVRSNLTSGFLPKGKPENLGYYSGLDAYLFINDNNADDEGYCSLSRAIEWEKYGHKIIYRDGKPLKVEHPDWHSHSWLTPDEFERAMELYRNNVDGVNYPEPEYEAILAGMRKLEEFNNDVRVVFWFDN